jgi:sigma-E factor negative regulatory protein RseC
MIERGIVIKREGNDAWVELTPGERCKGCAACHLLSAGKRGVIAENTVNAAAGDMVEVEICQETKLLFPFIVFGLPVLFLFLGIIVGGLASEVMAVVLGFAFLISSYLFIKLIDRYVAGQKKYKNAILRRL